MTREQWLQAAIHELRADFTSAGMTIPDTIHVSTGFPSRKGMAVKNKRIGECWDGTRSSDNNPHIFIHPSLNEDDALATLVHELVHASIGCEHGHKATFKRAALAIGLEGKMTATTSGPKLTERLNAITNKIGKYPHAILDATATKKQGTRLVLLTCSCARKIRLSRKTVNEGPILCGRCETTFEERDTI